MPPKMTNVHYLSTWYGKFGQGDCYVAVMLRKLTPEFDPELYSSPQVLHLNRFVVPCNVVTPLHSHDSSTPAIPERPSDLTMDPFSLSTGIVGLIVVALNLVVGTTGLIDKTVAAYDEVADELKGLEKDLKQLQNEMVRIHGVLDVLASNTKDRAFKKMLKE